MTTINEVAFTIELPGEWSEVDSPEAGALVYRQADGSGELVVMLLQVKRLFQIADQSRVLSDYVSHRMKYEVGQTPTLLQSEPTYETLDGVDEAAWSAADPETDRVQAHRVLLTDGLLAHFCFEAAHDDPESWPDRAAALLGSAAVTPPAREE